ncbi:ABC transporter permease [Mycolicibacterium conceptionense]|jgi:putative ABC transport system permease protein|uniref:ABC transporter permease n=2 Tax=Mycolicibacterium TaxID=1866885 RepID=A0A0J8U9X8_9MYCO|nr:ABC transporter permease [Mycolicibacterium conceptionense]KMV18358.1 ABC transporter permease [Mycolicibacterium conceptionense]
MIWIWLSGLLRRRRGPLVGAATGVAVAVALIATLGAFLATSQITMTDRAIRSVAVDWQIQLAPGADTAATTHLVQTSPGVQGSATVGFAHITSLVAGPTESSHTTGPGVALGLPAGYRTQFPGQIRSLVGAETGVLLAQQTAANLHAAPGDTVTIGRAGLPPATVTVNGIVELPQANSLFQTVGAPAGAQPAAPPDNVVMLPDGQWHQLFDPLAVGRPELVSTQIHVRRTHHLPPDPAVAYTAVHAAARHLEAASAGSALVGDNLGAALDAARSDAAYARILFLFLGLPAVVLAALLTATVTSAGASRRRAEQALLQARGATARQILSLAAVEAALIGATGAVAGLFTAASLDLLAFGAPRLALASATALGWSAAAAATGMAVAGAAVLLPARRALRDHTVASRRTAVAARTTPVWARMGVDFFMLAGAALVYLATTGRGYQLVLAPEGVPAISVSYWAFAGPALLWIGAALLTWRLTDLLLGPGRTVIARALRPIAGSLAATIANSMARARRPLVNATILLAIAIAFAVSTATFNATYRQQAEVDAQLTNGADITVTTAPGADLAPDTAGRIARVTGVRAVEPMIHRFAYIGADLQDLYDIHPATLTRATTLADSYFPHATATTALQTLATHPDSILVSAETAGDFQLQPGDPIILRINDSRTNQPHPVTFRYTGVVNEFPTAPKDSFFVVNADYLAAQTGAGGPNVLLVDTSGRDTGALAERVRDVVGNSAIITDIATVRGSVGSSLSAVDLFGLTRIELSFALILAVSAGALVLGLGLAERRRTYALLMMLGARTPHLRAMVFSETGVVTALGVLAGATCGWALSAMLVSVLRSVFDPPPDTVAIPWLYLGGLGVVTVGALAAVSAAAVIVLKRRPAPRLPRDL